MAKSIGLEFTEYRLYHLNLEFSSFHFHLKTFAKGVQITTPLKNHNYFSIK